MTQTKAADGSCEDAGFTIARGIWRDGEFSFPIRTYYEDTDLGGMVYHARYISFFERIRSESIRGTPLDVDVLLGRSTADGGPLIYVVRSIAVTYHAQAKAGDILTGFTRVACVRAAALETVQRLEREGALIAEAKVLVALVGEDGRPRRWPLDARATWQAWQDAYEAHHSYI